jgi:hypothetical protein
VSNSVLTALDFLLLKLEYDGPLSNLAFCFTLRHYFKDRLKDTRTMLKKLEKFEGNAGYANGNGNHAPSPEKGMPEVYETVGSDTHYICVG